MALRDFCKSDTEQERLDTLNRERAVKTKDIVAEVLKDFDYYSSPDITHVKLETIEERHKLAKRIAKNVSNLDQATQEMKWACDWYGWNSDVVDVIDNAAVHLGEAMAFFLASSDDLDEDNGIALSYIYQSLSYLSKALASLVLWFEDEEEADE